MIQGEAQMTKTLIETTWQGLEAKIAEAEARAKHGRGTGTGVAKPLKFDGTTSWATFQHPFEIIAKHNWRTSLEKSTQEPLRKSKW
jgi:hypothetical protein